MTTTRPTDHGAHADPTLISQGEVAEIYRVRMPGGGSLVVKAFREPWPTEIRAYGLLARLGVPTLRHCSCWRT